MFCKSLLNVPLSLSRKFYTGFAGYGHSKAAQIMFTKFLDAKLASEGKNVRVLSFHPGIVKTELYDRDAKWVTVCKCLQNSLLRFT